MIISNNNINRNNNFDFLRLLLASFVIITHSFGLLGLIKKEWLLNLTGGQIEFSYIGVKGFFIISGYLIFESLKRSKSIIDYYWKRILRLFPALIVLLIITILLAPFVYESSIPYLKNKTVWTYIPKNISLFKLQYSINGVFSNNPYKTINGSLWTIPYEFSMYIVLSFLLFIKNKKTLINLILITLFLSFYLLEMFFMNKTGKNGFVISYQQFIDLGIYFIGGSLFSSFELSNLKNKNCILFFLFFLLFLSFIFSFFFYIKFLILIPIILFFGLKSTPFLNKIGERIGDLSYGIYIYSFPVQQALIYYFNPNYKQLMIFSFLITLFFAYMSWHLIEKKALKFKYLTSK